MPNARSNAQQIAAASTEYHAIGPFAAGELLDHLSITITQAGTDPVTLAPVLHPTPNASAATIAAGSPLIEISDLQLAGANALRLHITTRITVPIYLPIKAKPQTAPMWVHVAIQNHHATEILSILMSIVTTAAPTLPTPAL